MARKQMQIPGTERNENPEVEKAAEELREAEAVKREATQEANKKRIALLAVMRSQSIKIYRYYDENGVEQEAIIDDEPTVKVHPTGNSESDIGDGVPSSTGVATDDVPPGLVEQAMKAQADMGVQETPEGDVIPLETAKNGKKKPGGRRKS